MVDRVSDRRRVSGKRRVLRERQRKLILGHGRPRERAGRIADEVRVVARHSNMSRRSRIVVERVCHLIVQRSNFIRRQARDSALWQVVEVPESSKVKMRSFFPDVGGVEQYLARQFLLESETPGLLVRNVAADALDGPHGVEADVVERTERASG